MTTQTQLATGLAGAVGSSFRNLQNQLIFVEEAGKLSKLDLLPSVAVISQGTAVLKGTFTFDLDNGTQGGSGTGLDLWWEQMTSVERQMTPQNEAALFCLGVGDFDAVTPAALQLLPYSKTPIPGSNNATNKLIPSSVFAVRTTQGNYAKVKVVSYGYDLSIQWVTYHPNPAYTVLGTGYTKPADVKISTTGAYCFVTERGGELLRVGFANPNRSAAAVIASGMSVLQQLFLAEAQGVAYVIEHASPGKLWRVNLAGGAKTVLLSNLEFGVGLVLSADLQRAYVSEQTTGPDKGRISCIQLNNGERKVLATGLVGPGFLTWADATETALLVTEGSPANRVTRVGVNGGATVVAAGLPSQPASVALIKPDRMLVCCAQVIDQVDFVPLTSQADGPLLMGIGFIPFDKIDQASGLASTDPGYFYAVSKVPFGGTLPIMVNHQRAANEGAKYYRVRVDGALRSDAWSDYKWNGTQYVLQAIHSQNVDGKPSYPVHPLNELFLWLNPSLGMLLSSTNLTNAMHTLTLEIVNATGTVLANSPPLKIMVNNQSCVAALTAPTLNGVPATTDCGVLKYGANTGALVALGYTASHPANYASYSLGVIKGIKSVLSTSGNVPSPAAPLSASVEALLETCTVAGFAEHLHVATTINNGWSRQGQYDAAAGFAFVLTP